MIKAVKTYKTFIKSLPEQDDSGLNYIIDLVKQDKDLPDTADIRKVAEYLAPKLNNAQTYGFQKSVMIYKLEAGGMMIPDARSLAEVNYIVELQDRIGRSRK